MKKRSYKLSMYGSEVSNASRGIYNQFLIAIIVKPCELMSQ